MKKFWILLSAAALLIPSIALAGVFQAEKNVSSGETISGNLYLAGSTPIMNGRVEGDLYTAGGTVIVTGSVRDDLVAAGGNITVSGEVGGDLRAFGGSVFIDSSVNGEVITSGGNLQIGPNARINGDLTAAGGTINIDPNAQITGSQIIKTGESQEEVKEKTFIEHMGTSAFWIEHLMTILIFFVVGSVFLGLFPNVLKKWATKGLSKDQFFKSVGLGSLLLFVTPIAAVLLMLTVVGALLGAILFILYFALILLNMIFAGIFFGEFLKKWITKSKKIEPGWAWGLGGIAALHLISLIPYVGWIVALVFFLFSWGTVASVQWNVARTLK